MDELRAALRALPEDMAREASEIVQTQAEFARQDIQRVYPSVTGTLANRVDTSKATTSRFGAGTVVRSRAPHSAMYEFGTKPRRTASGANRGRMPAADASKAMIPIVIRRRRQMVAKLIELVRRAGFTVDAEV